jgi:hypothetical protein
VSFSSIFTKLRLKLSKYGVLPAVLVAAVPCGGRNEISAT